MTIGNRIKNRRKELKLSVDELAKMLNKNRATVYRYENDEIENLPYSVIERLSEALKTTPSYLMGWTENEFENVIDLGSLSPELKNLWLAMGSLVNSKHPTYGEVGAALSIVNSKTADVQNENVRAVYELAKRILSLPPQYAKEFEEIVDKLQKKEH
ncbi:MAG: helix-turn-helix transcriptional regulator [Bacillota bacterium]|nr:helix-turn-helix transcriptional regulator [Bacillota bacterium]